MEPYETTLGDRLGTAIERKDISVSAFHRALNKDGVKGSSYAQIHRYLRNKSVPSIEFIEAAAELLDVRAIWLVSDEGAMTEGVERLYSVMWTGGSSGWTAEAAAQFVANTRCANMQDSIRAAFLDLLADLVQIPRLGIETPEQTVALAEELDGMLWDPIDRTPGQDRMHRILYRSSPPTAKPTWLRRGLDGEGQPDRLEK